MNTQRRGDSPSEDTHGEGGISPLVRFDPNIRSPPLQRDSADPIGTAAQKRSDLHGRHIVGEGHEIRIGGDEDHSSAFEGQLIGFQRKIEIFEASKGFQVVDRIRKSLFPFRPFALGSPRLFGLRTAAPSPGLRKEDKSGQQADR